jgi:hypothetical protein
VTFLPVEDPIDHLGFEARAINANGDIVGRGDAFGGLRPYLWVAEPLVGPD